MFFCLSSSLLAQTDKEEDFIYNLIKFTNWEEYVLESEAPFLVGVFNSEAIYETMSIFFKGKKCFEKNIKVKNILAFSNFYDFDIIYLPEDNKKWADKIIELCFDYDIISITSNNSGFCKKGGIINLETESEELKIQVNNAAALKNNIYFSPQLLNLVEIIEK